MGRSGKKEKAKRKKEENIKKNTQEYERMREI